MPKSVTSFKLCKIVAIFALWMCSYRDESNNRQVDSFLTVSK